MSRTLVWTLCLAAFAATPLIASSGAQSPDSGPGLLCDEVSVIDAPVVTGQVNAAQPVLWFESTTEMEGTYLIVATPAPVSVHVTDDRYLGWGWKCGAQDCDAGQTSGEPVGVWTCTLPADTHWIEVSYTGNPAGHSDFAIVRLGS